MRPRQAVLAVVALGVLVFTGAPAALAQDDTAQRDRRWLDQAEAIEQYMRDADVVDIEDIGVGVTKPKRAELAPGGPVRRITFKAIRPGIHAGFYDAFTSEIAAYELDKLLGLAMVPPAVEKHVGGDIGAAIMWLESAKSFKEMGGIPAVPRSQAERWTEQLIRAKMFHCLVGNTDPNQGNWLVYPAWNLVLIDHSRAFTTGTRLVHELTRIDQGLWEQFKALDEATLTESLSEWIGGAEIRAILKRRDKMAELIVKRVAEEGEEAVFGRAQ